MTLSAGTRLGSLEILAAIAAGGMGEVYRARDTKLDRDVAIKVLPTELAMDRERLARFEREAKLLASLNHPNIAHVYGFENATLPDGSTTHFLTMELVEGEDLSERLKRGPIPVDEATAMAKQVVEGLEEAHEHGIIHRDLKPANVKVTPDGKVKILDFGLAKAMEGDPGAGGSAGPRDLSHSPTMTRQGTEAGMILGTAAYMSPEQARGKKVDRRSDLWSFGVLLFEMLSGKRPFTGETVSDTLAAVMRADIDWTALPKDTTPALIRLLRRCLERDPQQRLRDAGDARLELVEPPAPGPAPAHEAPRERRTLLRPLAISVLAVVAALIGWLAHVPAAGPAYWATYLTVSGHDRSPAVSRDGQAVAFVSDRDGRSRIWIRQFATGAEVPLSEGPMDDFPRFSPDGSTVLFTRFSGEKPALYRIPSLGGGARRVLDDAQDASYSLDGKRIVFLRVEPLGPGRPVSASIYIANSDGGSEALVKRYEDQILGPRLSPDGSRIAAFVGGTAGNLSLHVVSVDGSSDRALGATNNGARTGLMAVAWRSNTSILAAGADLAGGAANATAGRIHTIDLNSGEIDLVYSHPDALSDIDLLPDGGLVISAQMVRQNIGLWMGSVGRRLTHGRAADRQPVFSPDGKTIVFSSERSGNLDLWSLSVDTGALRQITDDAAGDWDPAFTPEGRLLWASSRSGVFEIWTAESDGSASRQLTHDGVDAENPSLSPDGSGLVYGSTRPKEAGVWRARADGSNAALLVPGASYFPEISPDGRYVLYTVIQTARAASIHVARLADGVPVSFRIDVVGTRLTPTALGRARWTPDGRIAFIGQDDKGANGVFVQDFRPDRDTAVTRRRLGGFDSEIVAESFGVSPDGTRIALSGREVVSSLILLRPADR